MPKKKMVVVDAEKMEWAPIEEVIKKISKNQLKDIPKDVWIKELNLDKKTGAMSFLVRFDKGFHESKHTHPSDNFFTVLQGKGIVLEGNEFKKGMYCFTPAGVEHGPLDAPEGGVIFAYFNGPV